MNKYQIKDQKGRDTFKDFCTNSNQRWCKYVADATDPFSIWDVAYLSGYTSNFNKVKVIGEIKVRKYESDSFESWYLELDKLKALKEKQLNSQKAGKEIRITYINIFNDNMTLIWDLTDLNIESLPIKLMIMPKNDFDDTKVYKQIIELNRCDAERYETDEKLSIFKNYNYDNDDEIKLPF